MTAEKPILDLRNLSVQRNGKKILNRFNWSILAHQNWVLLGANGSGKTTLISALLGYFIPTQGTISVLGQVYGEGDWRELRQRIGVVSSSLRQMMPEDEPALHTVITGKYAMIDLWGKPSAEDARQARALLRRIGGSSLAQRPWAVLSQGERQRVLIARALMARPELLILDEPCAGLDPAARETFLCFLEKLQAKPGAPAMVLVTHHVEEISPMYTHALMMRKGRVIASGPMNKVLKSEILSQTFGGPMTLSRHNQTWRVSVQPPTDRRIL